MCIEHGSATSCCHGDEASGSKQNYRTRALLMYVKTVLSNVLALIGLIKIKMKIK